MPHWIMKHPDATLDMLGFIPQFLQDDDPRPAREQFDDRYAFGGGWQPIRGITMLANGALKYPGDPPFPLLAETTLRDEVIRFYQHAFVAIVQPDGTFEVSRMD